jgi:RNA polymerase sigma factor (sigma-70 family)
MDPYADELALLNALRNRDEAAFTYLVEQYYAALVRVAQIYVLDSAIAEEVAQETWLAVLDGLDGFEGRSSLKTWIFTILANKARTRGRREGRTLSYADLEESLPGQPTVDPALQGNGPTIGRRGLNQLRGWGCQRRSFLPRKPCSWFARRSIAYRKTSAL